LWQRSNCDTPKTMRVLITGGAGFVGAALAHYFREGKGAEVVALDNLHRRGSEQNLASFARVGIEFAHGDIRCPEDLTALRGNFDLLIEASAEPSVHAGSGAEGDPSYLLRTNLWGTVNCLEFARKRAGSFVFLSTSRVYSMQPLRALPLREEGGRFEINSDPLLLGASEYGIAESFATHLPRSLYGASKLASEMLVQEYCAAYGLKAIINRCGVIAGPGQFGKVDQGVFTLWIAHHFFGLPLQYTGFGGKGSQVRDLLHPRDLFRLLSSQVETSHSWAGEVFNVGGGKSISTSLSEWTKEAQRVSGRTVEMGASVATASVDIPWYLSDCRHVEKKFGWVPGISKEKIADEIMAWLKENERALRPLFVR